MTNKESFSKRFGHFKIKENEIVVREDAPQELRDYIRTAFYDLKKMPSELLPIVCKVLKVAPEGNWTEYPNIDYEIKSNLDNCEWFLIYDIIEGIIKNLKPDECKMFTDDLNDYFKVNGIGWKIENKQIETRGDEVFESAVKTVESVLESAKLRKAKTEIREALKDLSRRPQPDVTGAIQHSLACLECVTREVAGDRKSTLGELMKKFPGVIPTPLDQAVTKIWGFTSEQGRHLREGQTPGYIEAELIVEVSAAISTYLGKKLGGKAISEEDIFDF